MCWVELFLSEKTGWLFHHPVYPVRSHILQSPLFKALLLSSFPPTSNPAEVIQRITECSRHLKTFSSSNHLTFTNVQKRPARQGRGLSQGHTASEWQSVVTLMTLTSPLVSPSQLWSIKSRDTQHSGLYPQYFSHQVPHLLRTFRASPQTSG